jgi:holo-[acyl-carrier protein] synthase
VRLVSHGIDIVEVQRIAEMEREHGDRFLQRCYTPAELAYCNEGRQGRRGERLAVRFAAKEAVLKALGTGWRSGIGWTDVEVVSLPSGKPTVRLHGKAAEVAAGLGITAWSLSLSHTREYAVASAVGGTGRADGAL